jgi:hypothetical protein
LYGIPEGLPPDEFQAQLQALQDRVRPIAEGISAHDMRVGAKSVKDIVQTKAFK